MILHSIKQNFKNYQYQKERKKILAKLTENLGTIKEEDDKIICFVSQEAIDKTDCKGSQIFSCRGCDILAEVMQKKYDLHKPIHYVFENIIFLTPAINAFRSNLIFHNCVFKGKSYIYGSGNANFQDCVFCGNYCHLTMSEIEIQNCEFHSGLRPSDISVHANKLTLRNSAGNHNNIEKIRIEAQEATLDDVFLYADEISFNVDTISSNNSTLKATGIEIKNKNYDLNPETLDLLAPFITYNSENIILDYMQEIPDIIAKHKKRESLVRLLNHIKNTGKSIISNKVRDTKKELENQSISTLVRRKN